MDNNSSAARQPNIFAVDDTPANLRLLDSMLRERGYAVRAFPCGELALKAAEKVTPDLILLDINMPVLNGYEVCERLKSDPRLKEVPVIFISALGETMDKVRAFGVGGVDYIVKPFQFEEVEARVRTHLSLRQQKLELAESYRRLQELERLRDSLVHMVAHDLRSPLIGMIGLLQLVRTDLRGTQMTQQVTDIEEALAAASRLRDMVSTLLDVSRMEAGQMPLSRQACDLRTLVPEALASLLSLARKRTVAFEPPAAPVNAHCDPDVICRVIVNLVVNAIKFTPETGEIRVELAAEPDAAVVQVCDSGPGIPPEHHERIFEKFGQVVGQTGGRKYSTGLGLTFCRMAVEAHGGRIGLDSQVGKGSTFWFRLPARE